MRLLIVSDTAPYSTYDVYKGYCEGFENIKVPYETVNLVDLCSSYSMEVACGLLLSKLLLKENNFTHVLFVAGTMIPSWILNSKYDKKVCMIGTDDPHSSKMLLDNKKYIDYYFTNERNMDDPINGIYYNPTACSYFHLNAGNTPKNPDYYTDICFIGSVYPNRVKPLEEAIKWCVKNKKKITLLGPIQGRTTYGELFVPEDSIIHAVGKHCVVSNEETTFYHSNAKVVINMDRDTTWSPAFLNGNPHNVKVIPYSCNPRIYEVAASKAIQLYVDPRPEAKDLFGNNIFTCSTDKVQDALTEIFNTKESILNRKRKACYEIVKHAHTYTHRATNIVEKLIRYN